MSPYAIPIDLIIALLVAITIHEAAHAWMADKLGDHTARYLGRVTLNPIAHLDFLGTIMIFITFATGFGLGWGKPVPYNPKNLSNPRVGSLLIAIAGPISNLLTALVLALPLQYLLQNTDIEASGAAFFFVTVLKTTILLNVGLMAFNLLPIPPLDGSKVLAAFIPSRYNHELQIFFHYGPFILLGLIIFEDLFRLNILGNIIGPIIEYTLVLIQLIT